MIWKETIFKTKKPPIMGGIIIPITNNKKFKMYRIHTPQLQTTLEVNESYEGETIETKVNRILNNNEPIEDSAPTIWTDRKDGVRPEYNIRTDRFEQAVEMMHQVNMEKLENRKLRIAARTKDISENTKKDSGPQEGNNTGNEGKA